MTRTIRHALVAAALLMPASARGGACPGPGVAIEPTSTAPTNAQVRMIFDAPSAEVTEHPVGSSQNERSAYVAAADVEVILREASGRVVPATIERTARSTKPIVIVTPGAPMRPSTPHEIVLRSKVGTVIAARFTTGTDVDTEAPTLGTVGAARVYRWAPAHHWKDATGMFAEVHVTGTKGAIGFELHALGADARATASTLVAVIYTGGDTPDQVVRFGNLTACNGTNFILPAKEKTQRLAIRAFDAAGNVSVFGDVVLDLAHPRIKRQ